MPLERKTRQEILFSWPSLLLVLRRLSLLILLLLAVSLLLFQIAKKERVEAFRQGALTVLTPVIEVLGLPVDYLVDFTSTIGDIATVYESNQLLKAENVRLSSLENEMRVMQAENRYLRKMLNVVPEAAEMKITARVIGDGSGPFSHSVLINAGLSNGVVNGMAAYSDKGIVGRVVSVDDTSARVLLLTDLNARVPVITDISRERSIAAGNNTGLLNLQYLPEDTRIQVGELVIASGDSAFFPSGTAVGVVESVEDGDVKVRPLFDRARLEYVTLVRFVTGGGGE